MEIPKHILKKLKLRKEEDIKVEAEELEQLRAKENTKIFTKSLEVVDKIGKEIGEMREWAPYCSDPNSYSPFGIDILSCNKQQLLQLLMHAYGTAKRLKRDKDECLKEILKLTVQIEKEL
jgi:hypothetical protein